MKKNELITQDFKMYFLYCFISIAHAFIAFPSYSLQKDSLPSYLLEDEKNTIKIFRDVASQVVNVSSVKYARLDFFSLDVSKVPAGSGSGFVWDSAGHIITNFHVVGQADSLLVAFADGSSYQARLIGSEPKKDIAVLKLLLKLGKSPNFKGMKVANSSHILVGQKAIAIGSPFGFDQTLTTGIISAKNRSILGVGGVTIRDMIQTDAPINPGNSGGPLLNSRGELVGMNTAIVSKSGSSAGVGFAVPANTISRVVQQILKYGKVKQPGLGIIRLSESVNEYLGISGVIVRKVIIGGGADKAGLKGTYRNKYGDIIIGDIIVGVDNKKIDTYDDLYNALEKKAIGEKVQVKVIRNNKEKTFTVSLMEIAND